MCNDFPNSQHPCPWTGTHETHHICCSLNNLGLKIFFCLITMLFSVKFSDTVIQNATVSFQPGNRYFPSVSQPSEISISLIMQQHDFNNVNTRKSFLLLLYAIKIWILTNYQLSLYLNKNYSGSYTLEKVVFSTNSLVTFNAFLNYQATMLYNLFFYYF